MERSRNSSMLLMMNVPGCHASLIVDIFEDLYPLDTNREPCRVAARLLCLWDSLDKNTEVGCHFPLQGIFLTQGLNLHLLDFCIQFSSVAQSCPTLCHPMDCGMPGFPVHHQLPEPTQTHVHRVDDAIQPSHPLSSTSPPAFSLSQHQGLIQ